MAVVLLLDVDELEDVELLPLVDVVELEAALDVTVDVDVEVEVAAKDVLEVLEGDAELVVVDEEPIVVEEPTDPAT